MSKLTKAQAALLAAAAAQENGCVEATDEYAHAAPGLITRALLMSIPQNAGPSRLMITEAGRAAIGSAPRSAADDGVREVDRKTPTGKLGAVVALLRSPDGATIEALVAATGWQAHSIRGAMSGALKKKHGMTVLSQKTEAGRIYRIPAEVEA